MGCFWCLACISCLLEDFLDRREGKSVWDTEVFVRDPHLATLLQSELNAVCLCPPFPTCPFAYFTVLLRGSPNGKCFLWIILYILKYLMLLFSSFSFYHNPGCQLICVCISRVSSWRFLSVGIFLSKLSIQPYGYCAPQLLYGCKCSTLAPISIFLLLVLHSKRLPPFPVLLQFWSSLPSY